MKKVMNPHDSFFRETFGRKEIASEYLRWHLPSELVAQIDFESLTISKDSFVEKELRSHFSDLLYRVHHSQGNLYLYLLFEHKSYPDPWVGLQLLRYMVKVWELCRKQKPLEKKLPAVIPLVLYHGKKKWHVAQSFRSLIVQDAALFDRYVPDFNYQLHDLSILDDGQIKGAVVARIILLLLKHIFSPDLRQKLPEILSLLKQVSEKEGVLEILEVMLRYVVKTTEKYDENDIKAILRQSTLEEDIMETFIDKYIEQGMRQGMRQGMQQGMQQGVQQGMQKEGYKLLTGQLSHRFGDLPDWVRKKIEEADVSLIERWSLNLLSAQTMDDVFH